VTMKEQMEAELQEMIRTLEKANGALARIFNVEEDKTMSMCNWCGDEMKEGLWENHKCIEEEEGESDE